MLLTEENIQKILFQNEGYIETNYSIEGGKLKKNGKDCSLDIVKRFIHERINTINLSHIR